MQDTSLDHAAADVAWGAKAIGKILGLSERQAFHRLERGQIPCAKKIGSTWAASRQALIRLFAPEVV